MQTIWSPEAVPLEEWKYRNLKRLALPITDILFILGGILGANFGIPAIDGIFPDWVADLGGYAFSLVGLCCLIGVALPKMWLFEIISKSGILGMIFGYILALVFAAVTERATVAYIIPMAAMTMILPIWRLSLLSAEARERKAA